MAYTHTHTRTHTHTLYTDIWPADKTVNQQQQQLLLPIVNPNVLPSELRSSWQGIADLSQLQRVWGWRGEGEY